VHLYLFLGYLYFVCLSPPWLHLLFFGHHMKKDHPVHHQSYHCFVLHASPFVNHYFVLHCHQPHYLLQILHYRPPLSVIYFHLFFLYFHLHLPPPPHMISYNSVLLLLCFQCQHHHLPHLICCISFLLLYCRCHHLHPLPLNHLLYYDIHFPGVLHFHFPCMFLAFLQIFFR